MTPEVQRGKFITFEGLDGSGKSTQLGKLAEVLRADKIEVVATREPGGTETGERVRSIILDSRTRGLAPLTEVALMFASRAQQIAEVILPAVEQGKWVLCDRYTDSSEAYQGGGRQLGSDVILAVHEAICGGLQPDLTILMDSDMQASVSRARRRNQSSMSDESGADENRFEQENRAFFARVHETYHRIAEREPGRVFMLNAQRPIDVVHRDILREVRKRFMPEIQ